ncbi:MAG: EAL domain-containing protein [Gammaproteobacteria bacterium]|nr:EAL domain-containing protein [Gammaproteobacteria bacterium]
MRPIFTDDPAPLLAERVAHLSRAIPTAIAASLGLGALVLATLWSSAGHRALLVWGGALVTLSLARLLLYRDRGANDPETLRRWLLHLRLLALGTGLCWGAIAAFGTGGSIARLEFLSYVIAGITAGAAGSFDADQVAALAFQWAAIAPLVLRLGAASGHFHASMAVMGVLYGVYLTSAARRAHRQFGESTALKIAAMTQQEELRASERRYRELAMHDSLTGLPNRHALKDRLPDLLSSAARHRRRVALLHVDLDNFKDINDTHGEGFGDQVLREVAGRLRDGVDGEGLLVRIGGDEFIVVAASARSRADVERLARRLCATIAAPLAIGSQACTVQASIGIALSPDDAADEETLMRAADLALYDIKNRGRNGYQSYRPDMATRLEERVFIAQALRTAVDSDQFHVEYQPLVDLESERVVSFEALLRWRHPVRGSIPPGDFIPVAEQSGFIDALGEQAIRLVCRQLRAWRDDLVPIVPVAVNVSAHQLERRGFVDRLMAIVTEFDLDPALLRIEITESALMSHGDAPRDAILALRRFGVRIAIDDFGVGYCHLAYLKRLPIDYLKIDRSFVSDLENDARDNRLIGAIIALGRSFSIAVVAEGVETARQAEILRDLGCECAQGYYFHRPIDADRSRRLLEEEASRWRSVALPPVDPRAWADAANS